MMGTSLTTKVMLCRTKDPTSPIDEHREMFIANLQKIEELCSQLELSQSRHLASDIQELLRDDQSQTYPMVAASLDNLSTVIMNEARFRLFLSVPADLAEYYDNSRLFGDAVFNTFPSAIHDIQESGNCLACGNDSAAVFHLMRVAEHGLRSIAKKVGIKLTDKGKPQPIEFATWDKVITAINNKIAAVRTLPQGPKKNRNLRFYSDAAENCTYIRDIWRNEISHTRKRYNSAEAMGVLTRVRDFMRLLAERKP